MRPVEADLSSSGVPERPCGSKGSLSGPVRPVSAQTKADWDLYSLHGGDQRADTQDVHDPFEIVGQHVQGHLAGNVLERPHLKVGRAPTVRGNSATDRRLAAETSTDTTLCVIATGLNRRGPSARPLPNVRYRAPEYILK